MKPARSPKFTVWPPRGSPVSLATWLREVANLSKVTMSPPPFPRGAARGHGQPVIVLPGFCSLDASTARLRQFLTWQNFATYPWDCGPNIGPTKTLLTDVERHLEAIATRHSRKVALVGMSLGGTIAREIAKRRPDCVSRVVTLVSPIRLPVATPLAPLARLMALIWDADAKSALARVSEPPPVPLTAIVNPKDGVVDWRACVPDRAPEVEIVLVEGAHMTMGSNPEAQRVVVSRLAAG